MRVADAIMRGDLDDLRDELGDLLLQVVYHARMAEEQSAFAFGDVVEAVTRKMIRRHPHVFGDENGVVTSSHVAGNWDRIKAEEKAERAARRRPEAAQASLLSSVKTGQPALARAMDLQRKASSVGFDWNDPREVLRKIREEADESRPRSTAETKRSSPKRPAICSSRWSTWRATSMPTRKWRCAEPTQNSNGALPISSARWR